MKPFRFHPEADTEMIAAAKFYENQQKDLGKRYLASVQDLSTESKLILSYTARLKMAFPTAARDRH
jgi:hypothetical protein